MPYFKVEVRATVVVHTYVEADTPEEAKEAACELPLIGDKWELDDGDDHEMEAQVIDRGPIPFRKTEAELERMTFRSGEFADHEEVDEGYYHILACLLVNRPYEAFRVMARIFWSQGQRLSWKWFEEELYSMDCDAAQEDVL